MKSMSGRPRHQPVLVLVLDLHKASSQTLLMGAVNTFRSHHFGISERNKHCLEPVRHRHAIVVGKQKNLSMRLKGPTISSRRRPRICLGDETNGRIAPDNAGYIIR